MATQIWFLTLKSFISSENKIDKLSDKMFQDKDKHLSEIKSYKRQINYKNSEIETLKKQLDLSNFNGFMGKSLQNPGSKQDQKETHPIYEEFHEIVLKNEKLEKANHLLEYKVQQVEEDYEELKVEHNKTQIELRNSRENCRILETEYDKMRILKEKLEVDISEIKDEFELSLRNYQNSLVLLIGVLKISERNFKNNWKNYWRKIRAWYKCNIHNMIT